MPASWKAGTKVVSTGVHTEQAASRACCATVAVEGTRGLRDFPKVRALNGALVVQFR